MRRLSPAGRCSTRPCSTRPCSTRPVLDPALLDPARPVGVRNPTQVGKSGAARASAPQKPTRVGFRSATGTAATTNPSSETAAKLTPDDGRLSQGDGQSEARRRPVSGETTVGLEVGQGRHLDGQVTTALPVPSVRGRSTCPRRGQACSSAPAASPAGTSASDTGVRNRAISTSRSRTVSRKPAIALSARTSWRRTDVRSLRSAVTSTRRPAIWVC